MKKFLKKAIVLLNVLAVIALLIAYLSPHINPVRFWGISFFGLFFPIFFIYNIAFLVFWLFTDIKWSLLSLIVLLLGYFHFFNISLDSGKEKKENKISVASYNIMGGWIGKKNDKSLSEASFSKFLDNFNQTDILVLQESSIYTNNILDKKLITHQRYHADKGVVIYSKFNIIDQGIIEFGTKTNSCLWVDVKIFDKIVRVYGIHLQSNKITNDAIKVADNPNIQEKKTWIGIKEILGKYKDALLKRAEQADQIATHMASCPYPIIAAGDFNDPSLSYAYATIKGDLNDAFVEAGSGLGVTYAGKIPFLRIDYNLFSNHFQVIDSQVIQSDFSDHYPVISKVKIKE